MPKAAKLVAMAFALALILGSAAARAASPLIGTVLMVGQIEWFQTIEMGMRAAAVKYGAQLAVANAEGDLGKEAQGVDDLVARGVKALIMTPLSRTASVPALQRASAAGVKLIFYNTRIDSPLLTTYVGVDNRELGTMMGTYVDKYVTTKLGGKAKIALLTVPDFPESRARRDGFVAELKKVPGIQIVAEQRGELPDASANTLETILQAHPDVQLVWSAVEGGLVGSITARRSLGLSNLKLFGTDMSLQVARALLDPTSGVLAVATQDPYAIGYKTMQLAIAAVDGKKVGGTYAIPLQLFTADHPEAVRAYLKKFHSLETHQTGQ